MHLRKVLTERGLTRSEHVADVPTFVVPKELYRFSEDGVDYVYTACGRTFLASVWDEKLCPPKTPVLPKGTRGKLPRKPLPFFEDDMLYL